MNQIVELVETPNIIDKSGRWRTGFYTYHYVIKLMATQYVEFKVIIVSRFNRTQGFIKISHW